jgi:hypothetical protein
VTVSFVQGVLREILHARGFERDVLGRGYESWQRHPRAVITPFFAPHVLRKGIGAQIHGLVGVNVVSFEREWRTRLAKHYPRATVYDTALFGCYVTNFEALRDPPTISQRAENALVVAESWVDAILNHADGLPDNMNALISGLVQGSVGPYPARMFLGHWVKWIAFLLWLRENSYEFPPSLYELNRNRRVDPYDAIYDELSDAIPAWNKDA